MDHIATHQVAAEQSVKLLRMYVDYVESICEMAADMEQKLTTLSANLTKLAASAKESQMVLERIEASRRKAA